jgi:dTDP-4-dehydrorhamnose 3,5-epimerase
MAIICAASWSRRLNRVRVLRTELPGLLIVEPDVHVDERGFFLEAYHQERYEAHGIAGAFVQDNHSRSVEGTLRGLHLQVGRSQAKLVRVIVGEIFDVGVDVRRGSPTFGRWVAVTLSAANFRQCYIPQGFAHGFCVLSPVAEVEYKCTAHYEPGGEVGIAWNDPTLSIAWPIASPLLSSRDQRHATLAAQTERLPVYTRGN